MGIRSMNYIILATGVKLTDEVSRYLKESLVVSDDRGRLFVYESNFTPMWGRDAMGAACTLDLEEEVAIQRFLGTLARDAYYMKRAGDECGIRGKLDPKPFRVEPDVQSIDSAYEESVSDATIESASSPHDGTEASVNHAQVVGTQGQLTFEQIMQLLGESDTVKFNYDTDVQLEIGGTSFYVRRPGAPEYTFNEDAAPTAIFDGCRLSMADAQGFTCVFELDSVDVVYLANATGDYTGYGTLDVTDGDLKKVPFGSGPGGVLPYLTEIAGKMHVQGNLEVAFKDEFWGEDAEEFDCEETVRGYCEAVREFIRPRLAFGALLLPLDESDPGRIIVQVAIPLDSVTDSEDALKKFSSIFGTAADQANVNDLADRPDELQ
jgi:hypothetical protein